MNSPKYVVITRSEDDSQTFANALTKLGLKTVSLPTIRQIKNLSPDELEKYFSLLSSYDWLIFTSSNGVRFFVAALNELRVDLKQFPQLKIAAVGEKTAETAKRQGLQVDFIPPKFTTNDLAQKMPPVNGKKILMPRSAIGTPDLEAHLEKKGAIVTDMPIYTTITQKNDMEGFWKLFASGQILSLTFTSPSTVAGFVENVDTKLQKIRLLPVCSIGPATTKALYEYGFTNIHTADTHTTDGMVRKIRESIL
ncbi:MAG: uroporphyrinogen-III synthase [Candidatus Levyibacteriota bacterium]